MRVYHGGEALVVIEEVESLLELALDESVLAEDLLSVQVPLSPCVSGSVDGAGSHHDLAGRCSRRRVLGWHA